MRRAFAKEDLDAALRTIASHLERLVTCYLIGGGAMTLRARKPATKDIDLVLPDEASVRALLEAMSRAGFAEVHDPGQDYRRLGARTVFENERGMRFDIYERIVAKKLTLSGRMQERSQEYGEFGRLRVRLASPEDIFLFKAVAGRPDDLHDMSVLAVGGLDWARVKKECFSQEPRGNWPAFLAGKLEELEETYDIAAPILEEVRERAGVLEFCKVLAAFLGERAQSQDAILAYFEDEHGFAHSETEAELSRAVRHGLVQLETRNGIRYYSSRQAR